MKIRNIYLLITCGFLIAYKPSYAMHGAIFNVARLAGVTTLPLFGSYTAYNRYEDNQKKLTKCTPVAEDAVKNWFVEKKKKLSISNVELISSSEDKSWSSCSYGKTGYIIAPSEDISKLNEALINKSIDNGITATQDNSEIARDTMLLKHELAHIINKDFQSHTYALATIPIAVEALSFGATTAFRKLCNIQEPKTLTKTMLRSSVAVGSILPKAFISAISCIFLWRYHEKRSDKFACEHAESRLELEEFAKWHKENESPYAKGNRRDVRLAEFENDPLHPAPIDRREMVEAYISQLDTAHTKL